MKTNYFIIQLERDDKYMALIGFAAENENMTIDEAADLYKVEQVKKASNWGSFDGTFSASYKRIPDDLKDILTPAQLGSLVDAFRQCYEDGKNA